MNGKVLRAATRHYGVLLRDNRTDTLIVGDDQGGVEYVTYEYAKRCLAVDLDVIHVRRGLSEWWLPLSNSSTATHEWVFLRLLTYEKFSIPYRIGFSAWARTWIVADK